MKSFKKIFFILAFITASIQCNETSTEEVTHANALQNIIEEMNMKNETTSCDVLFELCQKSKPADCNQAIELLKKAAAIAVANEEVTQEIKDITKETITSTQE